ncbi:MAG: hypothetical protein AAB619_01095 [Patescibacteria group bacterium]
MKTSIWSKLALVVLGLIVSGQACSISIGSSVRPDGGVFRSVDRGQTWTQKNFVQVDKKRTVSLDDVTGRVLAFNPTNSDQLYLGTLANGIWVTTNGGDQWRPTSLRSGAYDCLVFDPLNPQVMYTAAGQQVLKSIDAGQTWTTVYTESQPAQAVNCVIVDPVDDRQVWATTSGGKVLLSEDYGQRWTLVSSVPALQPRQLYISADGLIYIFSRTNGIYRSDTRGRTWTDLTPALQKYSGATDIRAVSLTADRWFLGTAYGLLKSEDRGVSWSPVPTLVTAGSIPIQSVAVNPKNTQEIFVTTDRRLHRTVDGGASWSVSTLPTGRIPTLLTFDPARSERLYFTTFKPPKK